MALVYVGAQTLEALTRPNVPVTIGVVAGTTARLVHVIPVDEGERRAGVVSM